MDDEIILLLVTSGVPTFTLNDFMNYGIVNFVCLCRVIFTRLFVFLCDVADTFFHPTNRINDTY